MTKRGRKPMALADRVKGKFYVDQVTGCHVWTAAKWPTGYGIMRIAGKATNAHRVTYELAKGPIPGGYHVDHLCRNRACVNPDHLEAVTPRENTLRGYGPAALAARRTHCGKGHELVHPNVIIRPNGHRRCRACRGNQPRSFADEALHAQVMSLRGRGFSFLRIEREIGISRDKAWRIATGKARIVGTDHER